MKESTGIRILALLRVAYPRQQFPDNTAALYGEFFASFEDEDVVRAVMAHVAASKWPPTVADITERIVKMRDGGPTAEEAWGEVIQQIRKVGWYGNPTFTHALVGRAVELFGGWQLLCEQDTDTRVANRAHFYRVYESLQRSTVERAATRALSGGKERPSLDAGRRSGPTDAGGALKQLIASIPVDGERK